MSDLNDTLAQLINAPDVEPEEPFTRRKQINDDELAARLKYYETVNPGFESTPEHLVVLRAIFGEHRNVFLTGGAGVGKTTFVKSVILKELDFRNMHWSVVATTGIAGSHLEGKTIHSFFGIGLGPQWPAVYDRAMAERIGGVSPGDDLPRPCTMSQAELEVWYEYFYEKWTNDTRIKTHIREGVKARLRTHEVLIVDEVSMLHGAAMLGYLDYMLRQIRGKEVAFGGLQVVLVGDFAQLPPVEEGVPVDARPDWAFLSETWRAAKVKSIELTKVFRQGDVRFVEFLNNIRIGKVTADDREYAARFVRNNMSPESIRHYTFLVPINENARKINATTLLQYPEPSLILRAEFTIVPELQRMQDWEVQKLDSVKLDLAKALRRRLLDTETFVRIGYPVMFTINDPDGRFVNGTRGFVKEVNITPRSQENNWEDMDYVVVSIPGRKADEPERMVALRRWSYARNRDQDTNDMLNVPKELNEQRPIGGKLPPQITVYPTVRQFPLIPASAITIHKSQGMSLDSAILALARTFAAGQVYVGLSRLRSPDGLVLSEQDFIARTDPHVMEFYRSIRESHE